MLKDLREKQAAALAAMKALHEKAAADNGRDFTADEEKEFERLKAEHAALKKQVKRAEDLEGLQAEAEEVRPAAARAYQPHRAAGDPAKKEFESLGEFLYAARFNQNDQRLQFHQGVHGEQRMDTGSSGGFAVPKQFLPTLRQVSPQEAVIRPRAQVIPAGDPPDAEVTMPALDQSTTNVYGGVAVSWIGEGGTKPDTTAALREISLKPYEVAGCITVTDKLLRNWGAASAVLETLLRGAVTSAEEKAFMSGDGNAKPLGIMNSSALLTVNRAVANQISFADVANMFSGIKMSPNLVFITNQSALPQLIQLKDEEGHIIWAPSARDGMPDMLMGRPVLFNERSAVLGSKGDLVLADLSSYLIKDGSGPFVAASEHSLFTTNKTIIKITWNVDGQPWLKSALKGEDGRSYSPFVALDIPLGS